jgi:2-polyprenyl-6-methoxyphenol hydroxylase-like FAD-dependent oxidoreductase
VGAGIVLQPTGQHVLAELGLLAPILAKEARLEGLVCTTDRGRVIVDLDYAALDPSYFGIGLHRGVLFDALFDAVRGEPRIEVRLGVEIVALRRARSERLFLVEAPGHIVHGPHDLVVVADGARSHLRASTGALARPYPWGALWFVARDSERRFSKKLEQSVRSTRMMLGLLPTGMGPSDERGPCVSLYWSIRCDAHAAWRAAGLGPWKEEILRVRPDAESVLAQIEHPEQVLLATYHDVVMPRWHTHNAVYLGDAAHAMSPQLGQGCNLALWDAMTLARCIRVEPTLAGALAAYSGARRQHLEFYQFATRWLTPLFQSDAAPLSFFRDHAMGAMTKWPYFQREMIRAMCGIKSGVLGGNVLAGSR